MFDWALIFSEYFREPRERASRCDTGWPCSLICYHYRINSLGKRRVISGYEPLIHAVRSLSIFTWFNTRK